MEKTKEQMIADLYALRGGLSVISGHTDEIRRQEELIAGDNSVKTETEKNLAIGNSNLQDLKARRRKIHSSIKDKQAELKRNKETYDHYIQWRRKELNSKIWVFFHSSIPPLWPFIVVHVICLFSFGFFLVEFLMDDYNSTMKTPSIIASIGYFGTLFIFLGMKVFAVSRCKRALAYQISDAERKRNAEIRMTEEAIRKEKVTLQNIDRDILRFESLQEQRQESLSRQINRNERGKKERMKQIEIESEQSKLVKAALNETYDSWLSESDWKNVDLLIYYLETSRADDLKEALQLVDKQRQTESIAKAIATAAQASQDTVHTATMRLAGAMEASFSLLSDKLSVINTNLGRLNTLVERGNEMSDQIDRTQREQLAVQNKLLSTEKLNGALLEKANRSSEELLNDLRYGQRYWVK